jgi:hypothetical protein
MRGLFVFDHPTKFVIAVNFIVKFMSHCVRLGHCIAVKHTGIVDPEFHAQGQIGVGGIDIKFECGHQ